MATKKFLWIRVSKGIFEHYPVIGQALWLFLWYIDKTTLETDEEGERVGYVYGGRPVSDQEAAEDIGTSRRTVADWRKKLTEHGYVSVRSTRIGNIVRVMKSKRPELYVTEGRQGRERSRPGQAEIRHEQAEIRHEQAEIRHEQAEIRHEQAEIRQPTGGKSLPGNDLQASLKHSRHIENTHKTQEKTPGEVLQLGPDGYSPIDGCTWKNYADQKRFPEQIEKALAAITGGHKN